MKTRITRIFTLTAILFVFTGCSLFKFEENENASRVKPLSKEAVVKNIIISRESLNQALSNEYLTTKIRAVEVFQNSSGASSPVPYYRLFEVEEESVYRLLGLEEIDMLVAINERLVVSPGMISQVVRLLPKEKGITLEVIRSGKTHILKVSILD